MKLLLKALPECYPESCCLVSFEIRTLQRATARANKVYLLSHIYPFNGKYSIYEKKAIGRGGFVMFGALEVFLLVELVK